MKKQSFRLIATALILGLSAIYITAAPNADVYRIEIPFEFQVGSKSYEAGTYRFKRVSQFQLSFLNIETGRERYVLGVLGSNYDGSFSKFNLRFHRYGDRHFLRQISAPDSVFSLPKTKAEKKAARSGGYKEIKLGS